MLGVGGKGRALKLFVLLFLPGALRSFTWSSGRGRGSFAAPGWEQQDLWKGQEHAADVLRVFPGHITLLTPPPPDVRAHWPCA